MTYFTRRRALSILGAAPLLAAGCGSEQESDNDSKSTGTSTFPVSVTTAYGTATVESEPARVVSVGYTDHDVILGLGVVPIAIQQWVAAFDDGLGPWAKSLVKGSAPEMFPVGDSELNIGRIVKLKPDLIIGVSRAIDTETYALLTRIAPTITRPPDAIDYNVPYEVQAELIGQALGRADAARKLVAKAKESISRAADFAGRSAAIISLSESGGFWVFSSTTGRGQFLEGLGFRQPDAINDVVGDSFTTELSAERFDLIEDVDVVVVLGDTAEADLRGNQIFHDLTVVRNGHVAYLGDLTTAVSHNDVLSIPYVVPRAARIIGGVL